MFPDLLGVFLLSPSLPVQPSYCFSDFSNTVKLNFGWMYISTRLRCIFKNVGSGVFMFYCMLFFFLFCFLSKAVNTVILPQRHPPTLFWFFTFFVCDAIYTEMVLYFLCSSES